MYTTALRMPVTRSNINTPLGLLLGGQYGEIIFLPKKKKPVKTISMDCRSAKPGEKGIPAEELLYFLDSIDE